MAESKVIKIAIDIILWATVGILALQILATAGTTSFQPAVVTIAILVVSIIAAIGVAINILKQTGITV